MAMRILSKYKLNPVTRYNRFLHLSNSYQKLVQFILSDIGEGIREVTVRDWFVKVGDKVSQFDDICLVESDKASVNITSRYDGVIQKIYHDVGDIALVGKALIDIEVEGEEQSNKEVKEEKVIKFEPSIKQDRTKAIATPAVRRIAKENTIDITSILGTGKGGRVMKEDILQVVNKNTVKIPHTPGDKTIPITGIKKAMVKFMTHSNTIPSFGYCEEINFTKLVELRDQVKNFAKEKGTNITYMPFLIKALSKALEKHPELNARVDEKCENITIKGEHNIGFAVDTIEGLLVPNIKNVQNLSILEIGREMNNIIEKAKNRKLTPVDMSGGTITLSNIGIIGGTYTKPLINPPELAIVGLGKIKKNPIFDADDKVIKAFICNASWTADHRVIDGATLARFSNTWKDYIENPNHLILDL